MRVTTVQEDALVALAQAEDRARLFRAEPLDVPERDHLSLRQRQVANGPCHLPQRLATRVAEGGGRREGNDPALLRSGRLGGQ
jgi:hypothetical protein